MLKLLTYTGFIENRNTMSWEWWYKSRIVASMSLDEVYQIGRENAMHWAFQLFWGIS